VKVTRLRDNNLTRSKFAVRLSRKQNKHLEVQVHDELVFYKDKHDNPSRPISGSLALLSEE